jgi:hypothetical protein
MTRVREFSSRLRRSVGNRDGDYFFDIVEIFKGGHNSVRGTPREANSIGGFLDDRGWRCPQTLQ